MAQKPDGKSAKTQGVSFTRPAAERIARTVRTVEQGKRDGTPLTFGPRIRPTFANSGDVFRTAKFTGSWNVDTTATIEFTNSTFTPQTATALNLFCGIADGDIGVCKDVENVWHLVSWEMTEVCTTRLINMTLQLNTASCEIDKTLVTSEFRFLKLTYPFATCSTATTPG